MTEEIVLLYIICGGLLCFATLFGSFIGLILSKLRPYERRSKHDEDDNK